MRRQPHLATGQRLRLLRCEGSTGRPDLVDGWDLGALRIREMDEAGIDLQVLSHSIPGLQAVDAEAGRPWLAVPMTDYMRRCSAIRIVFRLCRVADRQPAGRGRRAGACRHPPGRGQAARGLARRAIRPRDRLAVAPRSADDERQRARTPALVRQSRRRPRSDRTRCPEARGRR